MTPSAEERAREIASCIYQSEDYLAEAIAAALLAVERETLGEAAENLESLGPAHTYASENADLYRGFDNGVRRCVERIRALAAEKGKK